MESPENSTYGKPVFVPGFQQKSRELALARSMAEQPKPGSTSGLAASPALDAPETASQSPAPVQSASIVASRVFALDTAKPIDTASFPNQPRVPSNQILPTVANFQHLLAAYAIDAKYNVIKKKLEIFITGDTSSFDNRDNVLLTQIYSIAALNSFPSGPIPGLLGAVGDRNLHNPVEDWILSKPWDGVDRRQALCDTLVEREDFPKKLKEALVGKWALSAVAAALMPSGFHCRGVLTLQGPQAIGKTAWVASLVPDEVLRAQVVLLSHHLDGGNKDSITRAASHWLVEIGELDSSFKKDIARLKGFITADVDKVRRPYGRLDSEYPRRTVFAATVNDTNFLVDPTGNSRWWSVPVTTINFQHGIDMQQLFAQLALEFKAGAPWWLTPEEDVNLEQHNNAHRVVSAIRERILNALDLEQAQRPGQPALSAIEVLQAIGINMPSNPQCKECAGILRELLGDHKKVNGKYVWGVPLKHRQATQPRQVAPPAPTDDDLY